MGGRAAQLRLENGQRAADVIAAHVHGATGFGKADQRHQNVLQAKRQQQAFAGTKNHRAKITGTVDDIADTGNAHCENRPHQRDHQPEQAHRHGGDDWHKTGATKEGQRVRQADIVKTFVQHPDDDARDHCAQDAGINRLDPQHTLNIVGFQHCRVGGWQNAFRGQPEVDRQVHHRVANETGKCRDAFVLARQPQRDSDTEHYWQEAKSKRADFAHPDENRLQHRVAQHRDQGNDIVAAQGTADPEHDPAEGEQRHGQHKGFTQRLEKLP
ncbi:hypothetical protein D3C75_544510 [compost metagenome]